MRRRLFLFSFLLSFCLLIYSNENDVESNAFYNLGNLYEKQGQDKLAETYFKMIL